MSHVLGSLSSLAGGNPNYSWSWVNSRDCSNCLSSVTSSYAYSDQYSAKDSRGTFYRSLKLFMSSLFLSETLSTSSSHLSTSKDQTLPPQCREILGCLGSLSLNCGWKFSPMNKAWTNVGLTFFISVLSGILCYLCPMSENCCFIHFIQFFSCVRQKLYLVYATPAWLEVLLLLFKHT